MLATTSELYSIGLKYDRMQNVEQTYGMAYLLMFRINDGVRFSDRLKVKVSACGKNNGCTLNSVFCEKNMEEKCLLKMLLYKDWKCDALKMLTDTTGTVDRRPAVVDLELSEQLLSFTKLKIFH